MYLKISVASRIGMACFVATCTGELPGQCVVHASGFSAPMGVDVHVVSCHSGSSYFHCVLHLGGCSAAGMDVSCFGAVTFDHGSLKIREE